MRSINEKCAVIAVTNQQLFDVARLAYLGLWSMQHRGQDSSGIASYDGTRLHVHTKRGLVSQVYNEESLAELKGQVAIGHNRYATGGGSDETYNQPYYDTELSFAFAHNGNLPSSEKLRAYADKHHLAHDRLNDSGLMALALKNELRKSHSIEKAVKACWPLFTGAFSCVGLYKGFVFAFRDKFGIRPLSLGKTSHGYVVSSETVAIDIIGADFVRDIKPGELIIVTDNNVRSVQIVAGKLKVDAFEFIYLARPDSQIAGKSVYGVRYRNGAALATVAPVHADTVIGIPDSGIPAATGYAEAAGIGHQIGILKNRYIGRTFIEPEKIRKSSVELKFNIIREIIDGKDIILVDDSLVRGNTLQYVVTKLRSYGAKSVHVRIASPPVKYPDFYGIDTPNPDDLIAGSHTVAEITEKIGADSLAFLSLDTFVKSIGLPKSQLCLSSFNGVYPITVPYQP